MPATRRASRSRRLARLWPVLVLALAACTAPMSYREVAPEAPPALAARVESMRAADPLVLAGEHAAAALRLAPAAARGEGEARAAYNFLVARLVDALEEAEAYPWEGPLRLATPDGPLLLRGGESGGARYRELIATDRLLFRGKFSATTATREGLGAPMVAVGDEDRRFRENFGEQRPHLPVTAILRPAGAGAARLELLDPLDQRDLSLAGSSAPLAADFGAPAAMLLAVERIDRLGLVRLILPERYSDTARLSRTQPYDPERIPVLFVHGLQDTPATWTPMHFHLLADPDLRERYQFWNFSYPTGYPYPYSASLLRRELDAVRAAYPDHQDLVIIGHSMGGIISRLMLTDSGEEIWNEMFGRPPERSFMIGSSTRILRDSLIFSAREDIGRAIFIAAPHRGSELASIWIGRLCSRLVRMPSFLTDARNAVLSLATADAAALNLARTPNSIDTLSPTSSFVRTVNRLPLVEGVPYHTIAGTRGRGEPPDSSDGVVAYWSSHLEGAESERMVPSDHGAHQHPEGIEEVRRILRLHAGLPPAEEPPADSP